MDIEFCKQGNHLKAIKISNNWPSNHRTFLKVNDMQHFGISNVLYECSEEPGQLTSFEVQDLGLNLQNDFKGVEDFF